MNCDDVKDLLVLLGCGEVPFDQEEAVERHLAACPHCAAERVRLDRMAEFLETQRASVPPELLTRCRGDLSAQLAHERGPSPAWWRQMWAQTWLKPAAALALLTLGFYGGHASLAPGPAPLVSAGVIAAQPVAAHIRALDTEPDGKVRLVYDETRPRQLVGDLNDARIRALVLAGMRDQDPGLRVDSIDVLQRHYGDEDVRRALVATLRTDKSSGVRLKALEALRPYARDRETRRTLAEVLVNDPSPAIRMQVIDLLADAHDSETAATLQELLRHEENGYIRERSLGALNAMKASAGTF